MAFAPGLHHRRHPIGNVVVGNVTQHHSIGPNANVVAYAYVPQHLGPCPNVHVIAYLRRAWLVDTPQAHHHAIADAAVVTKAGITADDDAAEVVDHKVLAQLHLTWQFDAGDDLNELVQNLVNERKELPQKGRPHTIAPAAKTVYRQGPETLGTPVAPVSSKVGADIFEHGQRVGRLAQCVWSNR